MQSVTPVSEVFRFPFKIFAPRALASGFATAGLLRIAAGPTSPKGTCQVVSWAAATSPAILSQLEED